METYLITRVVPLGGQRDPQGPLFVMDNINEDLIDWLESLDQTCQELDLVAMTAVMPAEKWDKVSLDEAEDDYAIVDMYGMFRHEMTHNDILYQSNPIPIRALIDIVMMGPAFDPEDAGFIWINGVLFYAEDPRDLKQLEEDFRNSLTQ